MNKSMKQKLVEQIRTLIGAGAKMLRTRPEQPSWATARRELARAIRDAQAYLSDEKSEKP